MSSEPFDLEGMLKEIKAVYEKYGIPRGLIFVPDKLEITLQRIETDRFSLKYQETFSYLPDYVSNFAIQQLIQLWQQSGLPLGSITRLEKGVRMEMTGDLSLVASCILSELLIQRKLGESEFQVLVTSARKGEEIFTNISDLCWTWDENIAKRFNDSIQKIGEVLKQHPSITSEIQEIAEKYLPQQTG